MARVTGLHVVRVPVQTTLDAARTQLENQTSVRQINTVIDELQKAHKPDPTMPPIEALTTVAHNPFSILLDETKDVQGDLLLMGWEGGFNIGRIYESPVQGLIRDATSDIAILKNRGLDELNNILLPWGGGVHARLGLEIAARIARATGATVHLLRVVKAEVDVESEERKLVAAAAEIVDDVIARGDVEVIYHVQRAQRVTEGIHNQMENTDYDLVVIGASREWKMRNVLFGAIPDVVADQATCSVLMVRRYLPQHWSFTATETVKRLREGVGLTSSPDEN